MDLDQLIENLPRTSSITIRKLKSLDINTYFDLLNYFPNRYENYSIVSNIFNAQPGETVTIKGKIVSIKNNYLPNGLKIQKAIISDETGEIEANWFNQTFLLRLLKMGETISISGLIKQFGRKKSIDPKEYDLGNIFIHTGRIIPVYSEKNDLSTKTIREKVNFVLDTLRVTSLEELFPKEIILYNNLIDETTAYKNIHFPENLEAIKKAQDRLSFDELFTIQLSAKLVKKEWEKEKVGNKFQLDNKDVQSINRLVNSLPFKLTSDQMKVWNEIRTDLLRTVPMNRFLQGEVGSGKTVIAALACYLSFLNGYQSLLMAPTEILANQHYETIRRLFKNNKIPRLSASWRIARDDGRNDLKIGLLTSSSKISNFNLDLIIGTHALLSEKVKFKKVGLVIVDEQHRFGVAQRAALKEKGINPHLLTMTATPIPRTVALTLYRELNLSVINELPKNRIPIKSFFISKNKRNDCYSWIKKEIILKKSQVFVVCPFIDESQSETLKSVKAATIEYEKLKNNVFKDLKVGLLHGKLKSKDKEKIMTDFKNRKYDILVSTPVVEVGIDIPNATVMIIEGGERYGLASLHQLRGRVGRGDKQSYCFVFSEVENPGIVSRLIFFAKTHNGNLLAEKDLETRGPGNLFGLKQHGYLDLKIASLADYQMIEKTRKAAEYFINNYKLKDYPMLKKRTESQKLSNISKD